MDAESSAPSPFSELGAPEPVEPLATHLDGAESAELAEVAAGNVERAGEMTDALAARRASEDLAPSPAAGDAGAALEPVSVPVLEPLAVEPSDAEPPVMPPDAPPVMPPDAPGEPEPLVAPPPPLRVHLNPDAALLPVAPGVVIDEAVMDQEPPLRRVGPARLLSPGPMTDSIARMPALRLGAPGVRRGVAYSWAPYAVIAAIIGLPLLLLALLGPTLAGHLARADKPDNLPALTTRLAAATAVTRLSPTSAAFGAQTYPVAPDFAAYYAAHNGQETLGAAITPSFTSNLGETQFFAAGALVDVAQTPVESVAASASDGPGDLDPDLLRAGVDDSARGVVALALNQALLQMGSVAPVGAGDSGATYATLRAAALPSAFVATPAAQPDDQVIRAPGAPEVILSDTRAFVVEGRHGGASAGHAVPLALWTYLSRADVAPDGWAADFGAPLTEAQALTATVNGAPHHLLVQAFAQAILVLDQDSQDASGAPLVSIQPAGQDYLRTEGGPAVHAPAQAQRWLTADGALRTGSGVATVAVGLNSASAVTLAGPGQWVNGALWYSVGWQSPARSGRAWVSAEALTETPPTAVPVDGFDALSPSLAQYLAGRGSDTGVVVYDVTRGVMYTDNPHNLYILASSAKVALMVSYLEHIESLHRGPNGYETSLLTAMIEHSDNNAAQVIYDSLGGAAGQRSHMARWGITDYSPNPYGWGWARWSPGDMARLLTLLQTGKVLNASDRSLAFYLMSHIERDQQFGVGDSAPDGAQFWMKDGWVPAPDGSWSVNTSGIVKVGNETYIVTVYNGELGSFSQGISIVNHVCGAIGQALT